MRYLTATILATAGIWCVSWVFIAPRLSTATAAACLAGYVVCAVFAALIGFGIWEPAMQWRSWRMRRRLEHSQTPTETRLDLIVLVLVVLSFAAAVKWGTKMHTPGEPVLVELGR